MAVVGHMCRYGMTSTGPSGTGPVLKPTRWMTNSHHLAAMLDKRCTQDHEHVMLVGGKAAGAAIYPKPLCLAILLGVARQLREDAEWCKVSGSP